MAQQEDEEERNRALARQFGLKEVRIVLKRTDAKQPELVPANEEFLSPPPSPYEVDLGFKKFLNLSEL